MPVEYQYYPRDSKNPDKDTLERRIFLAMQAAGGLTSQDKLQIQGIYEGKMYAERGGKTIAGKPSGLINDDRREVLYNEAIAEVLAARARTLPEEVNEPPPGSKEVS